MRLLPLTRSVDIVVQEIGNEVLIYDLTTHKAYNLNETASLVYQSCNGRTTFEELKQKTKFTDEIIFLALDELKKENLLENDQSYKSPFSGMNRREAIRQVGLASMIALPVISSLVAPTAAHAQSGPTNLANNQACTSNSQCASGNCFQGTRCCVSNTTQGLPPNLVAACAPPAINCSNYARICCSGSIRSGVQGSCTSSTERECICN